MIVRLRRASTAIFVVYVVRTAFACLAVAPLWRLLGMSAEVSSEHGVRDDALLAALAMNLLPAALPFSIAALAAHALAAPYLHQLVLGCMEGLVLGAASRRAATVYPKALLLGIGRWALLGLGLGAVVVVAARVTLRDSNPHAGATLFLLVLLGGTVVLAVATTHDLFAVELWRRAGGRLDRSASWPRVPLPRPRALAMHALWMLAAALIGLGSELLARNALFLLAPPMLLFGLQQSLSLLATLARASWLAVSLDLTRHSTTPVRDRAPHAAEI